MDDPRKLVVSLDALPTLPSTLAEILRVANNPSAGVVDLEILISRDPTLAAKTLQVANSPMYGFRRKLGTIHEAVVALGTRKIRSLASALALAPTFQDAPNGLIVGARLWSHSLATAMWTQEIARTVGAHETNPLFTAGLMHDIGLLALNLVAPDRMREVLEAARASDSHHFEVEGSQLGTNHSKLGAALCAKWMLPAELTLLISHHHASECPMEPHAQILRLADWLASTHQMGNFEWGQVDPLPDGLLDAMELTDEALTSLGEVAPAIRDSVAAFG